MVHAPGEGEIKMDETNQLTQNREEAIIRSKFWGTIALAGVLLLICVYSLIFTLSLEKAPGLPVVMVILVFVTAANLTSIVLTTRHRQDLGFGLTFSSTLITVMAAALFLSGRTLTFSLALLIVAVVGIRTLSPQRLQRWYMAATVAALALVWVIEWIDPPWRQAVSAQPVGPLGAIIFAIVFIISQQSRIWKAISLSLRLKITTWAGVTLSGISIFLIAYSTISGRQAAIDAAQKEALAIASSQAQLVRADTEVPLDMARALAQALTSIKDPANNETLSRAQVNAMLRQVLIENPNFLGTYTLWEPNAFDGLDASYQGTDAHDETGRFIPYWVRGDDGNVNVSALIDYETPGAGDWYILPRQTKKEVTVAPLFYPIQGVDTVMASFVVPIVYDGNFYGIAGVDAPIAFVQDIVNKVDLYDGKAEAVLMTSNGTLISVRNQPELINKPATAMFPDFSDLQARIEAGDVFISLSRDGRYLRAFAPVNIGETGTHWSFALLIPFSEITATATMAAVRQGVIGLVLLLAALTLLWFLSGQIVRPVRALTSVATAVSQGNLNIKADVQATDETGVLADAFNFMIAQLRESFATLEERVAERTRNLELAAEVGRTVSQVRALDIMLTDAAELIRKQFNLYYVQVYLVNPSQTYINLQAGTGSVGLELLGRNHRLPLNTGSINGRAAVEKKSVVISDTTTSATFKPNPLLPNTRSEMAVPLLIGDKVVGVLDMQSEKTGSLNQDVLTAFEALAGQLAIAIQNATFLAETEQARAEVEAQARRLSRANWVDYLDAIHRSEMTGFMFEKNTITPLTQDEQTQQPDANVMAAPISITGESLGNLVVEMEGQSPISRTSELVNTVARQVAQQIESLRLLESAERYRLEAEEASRRTTREGWKDYVQANANESLSYYYDLREVRPHHSDEDQPSEASTVTLPLKVRDEAVGSLAIMGIAPDDTASLELANAVAERLSAHIESLRQYGQTQQALATTQRLAEREQALRQITSVVRGSTDPATILRSAARELGNLLGRKTIIRLETSNPQEPPEPNRDGNDSPAVTTSAQEA
jgi:GAF domain-containing protein/HAMP domain-containing protein/F0F1-type ATP synthase membrane subunit a